MINVKYVYILECTSEDELTQRVYDTFESAMSAAIDEAVDELVSRGFHDPDCSELFGLYESIEESIQAGDFVSALDKYNDIPDATQSSDYHVFIYIQKKEIFSHKSVYTQPWYMNGKYVPPSATDPTINMPSMRDEIVEVEAIVVEEKEGPCSHCGRVNDIGVVECWYCGNDPDCGE